MVTPAARGRRLGAVAVIALLGLPVLRDHDSFPLSTYPMYAHARGEVATFVTARAFDRSGNPRRLSMAVIARTDDPLLAQSRLTQAVRLGRAEAFCAEIAGRAPAGVAVIEVVEEEHDLVANAAGRASLLASTRLARCATPEPDRP